MITISLRNIVFPVLFGIFVIISVMFIITALRPIEIPTVLSKAYVTPSYSSYFELNRRVVKLERHVFKKPVEIVIAGKLEEWEP